MRHAAKAEQFELRRSIYRSAHTNAMRLEGKGWLDPIGWRGRAYLRFHLGPWLWVRTRVTLPVRRVGAALWGQRMFWLGCVGATLAALKLFLG